MAHDRLLVTVIREIDAPAQRLFDIVADPGQHPRIDGSGSVRATRGDVPARLSQGATFSMDMRIKAPYRITNTVVEFEEGRRIGWRHFNGHVWRYSFEPLGEPGTALAARTLVTEQWDARHAHAQPVLKLLRSDAAAAQGMRATLERLAALTEAR